MSRWQTSRSLRTSRTSADSTGWCRLLIRCWQPQCQLLHHSIDSLLKDALRWSSTSTDIFSMRSHYVFSVILRCHQNSRYGQMQTRQDYSKQLVIRGHAPVSSLLTVECPYEAELDKIEDLSWKLFFEKNQKNDLRPDLAHS